MEGVAVVEVSEEVVEAVAAVVLVVAVAAVGLVVAVAAVALVMAVAVLTIVSSDQVAIDPLEEVVNQCRRFWLPSPNHFVYLYITFKPVSFNHNIRYF
ncbi:unnamed protein product [Rodentolepis nana]|uniref:Uncharacterized protein n=1 Tax=Rodentolepis nana TaxID=102285 RepID=A0A0R3TL93_RODNA|nr:unnamed protein product [Rodentolepis nana]